MPMSLNPGGESALLPPAARVSGGAGLADAASREQHFSRTHSLSRFLAVHTSGESHPDGSMAGLPTSTLSTQEAHTPQMWGSHEKGSRQC